MKVALLARDAPAVAPRASFFRAACRPELQLEVVAVNDLASPEALARLLGRDSVFGRFAEEVRADGNYMVVGAGRIQMLQEPAVGSLPVAGRLEYADEPLVSSDVIGSSACRVFDAGLTMAAGNVVKVLGWYDNEFGYASRLAELVAKVGAAGRR